MELREALSQISEIRQRMAGTEVFRGYRSLPIALSGLLAIVGTFVQPILIGDPHQNIGTYCAVVRRRRIEHCRGRADYDFARSTQRCIADAQNHFAGAGSTRSGVGCRWIDDGGLNSIQSRCGRFDTRALADSV